MAALTNLGSNSGFIYVVDSDGTSIIQNLANNQPNVRKVILDASTESDLGLGSTVPRKRYFLNNAGAAGVLAGATEITRFLVTKGLNATLPFNSNTIAGGVISPSRYASITVINVLNQGGAGTDDLDTITATDYSDGDIIFLRGGDAAQIVTVKDATGNIFLANAVDFDSADSTTVLTLEYLSAGDQGAGFYEVSRSPNPAISVATLRANNIAVPVQGVNKTTLTNGGGTINIEPGVDKGHQVYDGTVTLAGSWVIQIQPAPVTPYLDGDTVFVEYRALATVGANSVTIFGIALTATQALEGRVFLRATYKLSNTTWYYDIFYDARGVDITNLAYVDATFEPALGNPAANGWILSSTTLGVRSWIPNTAISSVYVGNTVYVDATYGDNGTGLVERLDLPFATIAAARAALNAAYPLGARTGDVRYLIDVRSGEYNEQIILDNYTDYNLNNSIIDVQSGAIYTIDDNNIACDSIIYGNSTIKRSAAGTLGCIRTQHTSTNVRVFADEINNVDIGKAIVCSGGTLEINCNNILSPLDSSVYCSAGTLKVNGNITYCANNPALYGITSGTIIFNGDINCAGDFAIKCDTLGRITFNGNILQIADGGFGITCASGTLIINNSRIELTGSTSATCVTRSGGTLILNNCSLIAPPVSGSLTIADGSTVLIYGDCVGNIPLGTAVTQIGNLIINSSVV